MFTTTMGTAARRIPVQGLGCMRMGEQDRPDGEPESIAVINRAIDRGVTFLDTADMYSGGRSEEVVGRAIAGRRDEVLVCTKGGIVRGDGGGFSIRGDATYIRQACERSLRRLGVDVIDLYYLHRRDETVPIEESIAAMSGLVTAGKVRHLGLSEVTGDELRAAHAVHPITALQSEWSLCCRRIEPIVEVCVELGIGVVPYCPQGRGLLASTPAAASQLAALHPEYATLPDLMAQVARRHGVKTGQVALAWVHHRTEVWGVDVLPIPGTRQLAHLDENIAAADLVLDAADLKLLDVAPSAS